MQISLFLAEKVNLFLPSPMVARKVLGSNSHFFLAGTAAFIRPDYNAGGNGEPLEQVSFQSCDSAQFSKSE